MVFEEEAALASQPCSKEAVNGIAVTANDFMSQCDLKAAVGDDDVAAQRAERNEGAGAEFSLIGCVFMVLFANRCSAFEAIERSESRCDEEYFSIGS